MVIAAWADTQFRRVLMLTRVCERTPTIMQVHVWGHNDSVDLNVDFSHIFFF